jgi:hypothetical protein
MRRVLAPVVLVLLLFGGSGVAAADGAKPATRLSRDLAELAAPLSAADGAKSETWLSPDLGEMATPPSAAAAARAAAEAPPGGISAWRPAVTGLGDG